MFVSTSSVTIPNPFPLSSTTANKVKFVERALGILSVTEPFSLPPIGMSFCVKNVPKTVF